MKIKGVRLAAILGIAMFALAGCSSQSSSSNQSKSTSSQNSSEQNTAPVWNSQKDKYLQNYISNWQSEMNQTYQKYDGDTALKTSAGTSYPDELSQAKVDGQKKMLGWSRHGNGEYKYNVVAIYNYDGNDDHITYLFTFHKQKPVVLVDQSNSKSPDFKVTENKKLKSNFAKITHGAKVAAPKGQATTADSNGSNSNKGSDNGAKASGDLITDPKTVGLMAYVELFPGYRLESEAVSFLHYGANKYTDTGDYTIAAGGSAITVMYYSIDGDAVHCWKLDPNSADVQADETLMERTYSLKGLKDKYYPTAAKKQQIENLASVMNTKGILNDGTLDE